MLHEHQLEDDNHWQDVQDKKRQEWQGMNWDDYLANRITFLTKLVNDDAHWERLVEDRVKSLEKKRASLDDEKSKLYQQIYTQVCEKHRDLAEKVYAAEPRLQWSLTHADFQKHCDHIRQNFLLHLQENDQEVSPESVQGSLLLQLYFKGLSFISSIMIKFSYGLVFSPPK